MQAVKRRVGIRHGGVLSVPVDDISPNPVQPRKVFRDADLMELSCSIAEYGILNPLTVRLRNGRYANADCGRQSLRGLARSRAYCLTWGLRKRACLRSSKICKGGISTSSRKRTA